MRNKVIFRTDGNAEIGMGHITRSLALADMIKDHFDCYLATRFPTESIKEDALKTCKGIIELNGESHEKQLLELLDGSEIVVLDNYFFDFNFQCLVKEKGCQLVVIDDLHDRAFCADVIINHAPGVEKSMYRALPETKFYLGPDFALLRSQFFKITKAKEVSDTLNSVLLCFGGSDYYNYTGKIFECLKAIPQLAKINIVIGSAYLYEDELTESIIRSGQQNTTVYSDLSADEMITVMTSSDFAIVPASSILFEVIKVGMPVLSGYYIENQLDIYNGFLKLQLIHGFGDLRCDPDYSSLIHNFIQSVDVPEILDKQYEIFKANSATNLLSVFQSLNYESSDFSR